MGKPRPKLSPKQPAKRNDPLEFNWTEDDWRWTFTRCIGLFIADQYTRGNRPATIKGYNADMKRVEGWIKEWAEHFGYEDLPVRFLEAKPIAQMSFVEYLKKNNISQQTVNHYLRSYRAFGNYCLQNNWIDSFECKIHEEEPPIKEVYTEDELKKLLVKPKVENFCDFRNWTIITLICATGARVGTVLALKLSDVDLNEGYINFNTTKGKKVARIPLDRKVVAALREWIRNWRCDARPDAPLFHNGAEEPLSRSGLTCAIRDYNHSRGVEKTAIHLLRHTYAKMWITSGGNPIALSKTLTHSTLEMTKRYMNLYAEDIKQDVIEHDILNQIKTIPTGNRPKLKKK